MALKAKSAEDRAAQLLAITDRLREVAAREVSLLSQGLPLEMQAQNEEMAQLVNAYRFEMLRIQEDPSRIGAASPEIRQQLQASTENLRNTLDVFNVALNAAREISEGLVQAMAEEVQRLQGRSAVYGSGGAYSAQQGAAPMTLDRTA
jgi:uncharacterized protein involved in exopolysaccharide biosynthesis